MPVYLNEPLSILQKSVECFEYHDNFNKAAYIEDPCRRMAYILSGIFMKYSNIIDRITKPFNPLLGETYEYQDKDLKIVIE